MKAPINKSGFLDTNQIITDIVEAYNIAEGTPFIKKPLSYAMYQVWKMYDEIEKPRSEE